MWQVLVRSKWIVFGGGLLLGGAAAPIIGLAVRPVVRSLIKGGLLFQREAMSLAEGFREDLEDIVSDVKSEIDGDLSSARTRRAQRHAHDSSETPS
jgi:hypothetical protein